MTRPAQDRLSIDADGIGADGLRLAVRPGEVVHVAGPNGVGKTSLLRALAGLPSAVPPASATVLGRNAVELPAAEIPAHVAFAPDDPAAGLVGLTVEGEFRLRAREVPSEVQELASRDVSGLSTGEARRVLLATLPEAPVVLLDEPAEGLDSIQVMRLRRDIARRAEIGSAVLFTDHRGRLQGCASSTLEMRTPTVSPMVEWPKAPDVGGPLLTLDACTISRGERAVWLPHLRLGPGLHVVTGPNGSGKTTLLRTLAGLHGEARIDGEPASHATGVRMLMSPARYHLREDLVASELGGVSGPALRLTEGLEHRHPLLLSRGESQRVALAAALGKPCRALLLDEPEAHLDTAGFQMMLQAIGHRVGKGAVVVAATHDARLIEAAHSAVHLEAP